MAVTTLKRLGAAVLSAAILAAPLLTVSTADAAPARAGKHLVTIKKWEGAQQQACKTSVHGGKAWKVFSRVVNGRKAEVGVGLQVENAHGVIDEWRSPIMGKGKTSQVGSVVMPIKPGVTLAAFQFQSQMGDGGSIRIAKIKAC